MKENWKFFIAGVQFHQYKEALGLIKQGDILDMIPEPDNKYDANAVKLVFDTAQGRDGEGQEIFIGYVPGKISAEISAFLVTAEVPTCKIITFNGAMKPWEMFEVEISDIGSEAIPEVENAT